jgi:ribosome-associated translation inhibitor RaiA
MAWAGRVTMTKAIDEAIQILTRQMDRHAVCNACRDQKCELCYFGLITD